MSTINLQNRQIQSTLGSIKSLMQQLQTLAPHPDRPDYKGALFINSSPWCKSADQQDGMLGTMMLEAMVGSAFAGAINEAFGETAGTLAASIDLSNALECYSQYISDVEGETQRKAAHGQGTMARMSGTSISKGFNVRSTISSAMQAFFEDMPERLRIERALADCAKTLNRLTAQNSPVYAVPAPRFAA